MSITQRGITTAETDEGGVVPIHYTRESNMFFGYSLPAICISNDMFEKMLKECKGDGKALKLQLMYRTAVRLSSELLQYAESLDESVEIKETP